MIQPRLLLLMLIVLVTTPAWADDISGTVNTYVKGNGDVAKGATTINYTGSFRGASASISPGDQLLLIQSQGAVIDASNTDQYGDGVGTGADISTTPTSLHGTPGYAGGLITQTAGTFEYATVASVFGSQVTLASGLEHAYSDAGADNWQIVVVPDYLTAGARLTGDITGMAWDGDTGGVIAFNATGGAIDFNGFTVDAAAIGFRGGVEGDINATIDNIANVVDVISVMGGKGEGIAGTPRYVFDGTNSVDEGVSTLPGGDYGRGAPGNAGGGAGPHNAGGGGGSNAGLGGSGAQGWVGGTPVNFAGYGGQSIFAGANMGGGGGSGDSNNGSLTYGGSGGGVILLRANSATGSGVLDVSGAEATDGTLTGLLDGAGGGGAGGTVLAYFSTDTSLPGLSINAAGGKGGNADPEHGGGGGGGAGLVMVRAAVGAINTSGGAKGANEGVDGVPSEPGGDSTPDSGFDAFARLNTDYGDAPDSYGTISGGLGAFHYFADYDFNGIIGALEQLHLGLNLDGEAGGNPSTNADSDDNSDLDDEDGLTGLSNLDPNLSAYTISASSIRVTNTLSSSATLHAWIDFDLNGTFDSDEYASISIASGLNNQNPASDLVWSAMPGISSVTPGSTTYMRLRLSTDSTLDATRATGEADNGEVEDYAITVYDASPTPVNITRSSPTASVTNANQVEFAITFSENVQNVDSSDFSLSGAGAAGATIPSVSGSGNSYVVTVDVDDSAEGLVSLHVAATTGIQDSTGNDLSTVTPSGTVETYLLDNTAPVITRIDNSPVNVAFGSTYADAGATASDNVDGDITLNINTVNPVNTSSIGSYTVTYDVSDSAGNAATQVTRQVNVVDLTAPVITLIGSSPVSIEQGSTYSDAGATASDNIDGDLTADIVTDNPVDTSTVGTYTVTYDVSDANGNAATQVTRTVNVTSDATSPVITLLGSDPVTVYKDSTYADAGATASDNLDGDITANIVTGNPVDTSTIGSYTVTYDVTDATGNAAAQVTRTVNVILNPAADEDGDGISNSDEGGGDNDGDGVADYQDLDSDNDGIPDALEGNVDSDSDGIADYLDLDSDNDGLFDLIESGAVFAGLDADNNGRIDSGNAVGANGLADGLETTADSGSINYTLRDTDSDTVYDFRDLDSDDDGLYDVIEAGGSDGDNNGVIGTGAPVVDGAGVPAGGGLTPPDSDGDGTPDYRDNDDADGDGVVDSIDLDDDNDGILDTAEGSGAVDTDADGVPDSLDLDSDNDGLFDLIESGAVVTGLDTDNDGRIDSGNTFGSNGLADALETTADSGSVNYTLRDTDSDTVYDFRDVDSDADGIFDVVEAGGSDGDNNGVIGTGTPVVDSAGLPAGGGLTPSDYNGDGTPDYLDNSDGDGDGVVDSLDLDLDNDGIPNTSEGNGLVDTDSDGTPDTLELDSDNDGLYDLVEAGGTDSNNDGLVDSPVDANGDGLDDTLAASPLPLTDSNSDGTPDFQDATDTDGDGLVDSVDIDDDNDGILDSAEGNEAVDSDGDGIADSLDLDSDNDGLFDLIESGAMVTGLDTDNDGRIDSGNSFGSNGLADALETTADSGSINYTLRDSDSDSVHDFRDLDSDGDGLYDYLEAGGSDTDNNGLVDGFNDLDSDGLHDALSGSPLSPPDSDADSVPDYLDLDSDNDGLYDVIEAAGADSDGDGLLGSSPQTVDAQGVAPGSGLSFIDTDGDGVADPHDLDSDNDGVPDVSEFGGSDADPDGDGLVGTGTPMIDSHGVTAGPIAPTDTDADGTTNQLDTDADGDGLLDIVEAGGIDSNSDGQVDGFTDANGDGLDDLIAASPLPLPDADGDSIPDFLDNDDQDNDGVVDSVDVDIDNDGIPNSLEGDGSVDTDGDGIPDSRDLDSDNDGIYDIDESGADAAALDSDDDGRIDGSESVGANGLADVVETSVDSGNISYNGGTLRDTDSDAVPDFRDLDSDNDGLYDVTEAGGNDPDNDGVLGNGTPAVNSDGEAAGAGQPAVDTDGDGVEDPRDLDSDNDGVTDVVETRGSDPDGDGRVGSGSPSVDPNTGVPLTGGGLVEQDTDGDGIPNQQDPDSDDDGVFDLEESGNGAADSSPQDGVIDSITDADGNGWDDGLEGVVLALPDSDNDGLADLWDNTDTPASTQPLQTGLNGVGGCSISRGSAVDPLLPLLALLSLAYLGLRRRQRITIRVK